MTIGSFTFVLHSHLPYCRRAGRWPHGEEWIHEAASETYLPLLDALFGLRARNLPVRATIGLTPVLVEQLADPLVIANLEDFMTERQEFAEADIGRFDRAGEPERADIARWYADRYRHLLRLLTDDYGRTIVGAFKELQDAGVIEIATSAATHGYLPLMERDSTIWAQVATGVQTYRRHFGRQPASFWLPECAYRPPYRRDADGHLKPGLEWFLARHGLRVFFVETHTIEGGTPVGKAIGDAIGPYGDIPRRYLVPPPAYMPPTRRTTYLPYWVNVPEVAALGRNNRTGLQVWSAAHGYPGEFHYREFHKRDGVSGLHYWRVTGAGVDLGEKLLWSPVTAFGKVRDHAGHFAGLVDRLLAEYHAEHGHPGVISAAYDTELFGHWWFEGVEWLGQVLGLLAQNERVDLTSAGRYVTGHPPEDVLALPESSWGQGGNHFVWLNADNRWMWPSIHRIEREMESLATEYATAPDVLPALKQAAREALLAQSSDWPFLITTGQARDYAMERFENHVDRFDRLVALIRQPGRQAEARAVAEQYWELDKVFPDIDPAWFAPREP
ncbi:MAG: 1,4-alpha-glucan branching protein domain-containing protein [Dehalococcoidia bacterium]